ncbi:hypothetical protein SAMN06298226_1414 [Nitrosovibrio sp. Nv4]|nr:hypothetical protein SAMN06298226_1414 [Nitrosovibrio sp. Nv4]
MSKEIYGSRVATPHPLVGTGQSAQEICGQSLSPALTFQHPLAAACIKAKTALGWLQSALTLPIIAGLKTQRLDLQARQHVMFAPC